MKHFYRTHLTPGEVMAAADEFFPALNLASSHTGPRTRSMHGDLGEMTLTVRPEGGHYTFVEVHTNQMGESRLDRNVKRFFVELHRIADPRHRLKAAY